MVRSIQLERPEDEFDRERLIAAVCQQHGRPVVLHAEHTVTAGVAGGAETVICEFRDANERILYASWERLIGGSEGQALVTEWDDSVVVGPDAAALEFVRRLEDYERPDRVSR